MAHWIYVPLEAVTFLALSAALWFVIARSDKGTGTGAAKEMARAGSTRLREQLVLPAGHLRTETLEVRAGERQLIP
jgi:hypothetical protein